MNTALDGPFTSAFERDTQGIVKQELITYVKKNGMLVKEVTTRQFSKDGTDWHDTSSVQPLVETAE
jgi:hypothetical protein